MRGMKDNIKSWSGAGGSLMVSEPIPGVTQEINGDTERFYGGKHFIGETITLSTARAISTAMGWEYQEQPEHSVEEIKQAHVFPMLEKPS